MLLELLIQDFALIDRLKLEFSKGLNIMTGETGAGKSIIIDSVNFVLGERSSKDIIRTGVDRAYVEAVFDGVQNGEFNKTMEEYGIELDEAVIVLSREINQSGRSICRVNGKVVTTMALKNIGNFLLDIHGQHEHQSLLNEENHINLLDMFGGENLDELKSGVHQSYAKVLNIRHNLEHIMGDDRERERKLDLLNFQIKEIDDASLKDGEEEELIRQKIILNNSGKLINILSGSYDSLYEGSETSSIFDRLGYVLSEMHSIVTLDQKLQYIYNSIKESYYLLEGVITDIREYKDKIDFNPELINEVEMRLDLINRLKRKYGSNIGEILEYRETVYKDIQDISNSEDRIKKLKLELENELGTLSNKSRTLSELRKKTAKRIQCDIINELKFLGMEKSRFVVEFETVSKDGKVIYNDKGMDRVRFLISTNPGEPEKPLSKVASGGEISRIMLAIKTALANLDKIPSLIFDEIDTGISGKAAGAVAEKLGQISSNHQVICVTHLPQIASMADVHFYIFKSEISGKTKTNVQKLDNVKQIDEIARMLGGANLTDLTLKHAEEMVSISQSIKSKILV